MRRGIGAKCYDRPMTTIMLHRYGRPDDKALEVRSDAIEAIDEDVERGSYLLLKSGQRVHVKESRTDIEASRIQAETPGMTTVGVVTIVIPAVMTTVEATAVLAQIDLVRAWVLTKTV